MLYIKILTCMFGALVGVDGARILAVFPTPSISHQIVFRPLIHELARRGHEVTVITPDPAFNNSQPPANLTEIDVHDISYNVWRNEMAKVVADVNRDVNTQIKIFLHLIFEATVQQLLSKRVQDLIINKNTYFDLIITESCAQSAVIYSHIFKAPLIQVSSFGPMLGTNTVIGAPNHIFFQPSLFRKRLYNLTLWEKVREIYRHFKYEYINYKIIERETSVLKEIFGPDTPSMYELFNNVDMVFLNVHSIWNDNSPVPPGVIYLGGMHQRQNKELPEELLTYLEASKNGVIYLSFGTNVQSSMIPPETVQTMMRVFSELPYNVIWKWDTDLTDKPNNIKVHKWLPQADLLRHPKIKLFITQGGLQSTDEAITGGVPMIGIPVIADQWLNVEKYIKLGIGQKLELEEFAEEDFRNAIITVMENQRMALVGKEYGLNGAIVDEFNYRSNIVRLRTLMHDQPETPVERAIWWTEYVLRHGGARHLRSPAANMSWAEYYQLNLVFIVLTCLFTIIITFIMMMYCTHQYVLKNVLTKVKFKKS